jgi:hypothetical protein
MKFSEPKPTIGLTWAIDQLVLRIDETGEVRLEQKLGTTRKP